MTRLWRILHWAISVAAFTGCLLVGALWVRSYWRADYFELTQSPSIEWELCSMRGSIGLMRESPSRISSTRHPRPHEPQWQSFLYAETPDEREPELLFHLRSIRFSRLPLFAPHWVLMLVCAVIGAAPWVRWRFSVSGVLVLMAFLAAMFAILVFE